MLDGPEPHPSEVAHFSFSGSFPKVCPDETTLSRYATAQGSEAERAAAEAHLDGCAECRAVVAVLAQTAPAAASRSVDPDLDVVLGLDRLGEHYEVESVLGAGGMGIVLAATHRLLGSAVAIKVLRPSLRLHAGAEQRFVNEARAGARLSSSHVARVLDAGRTGDGLPWLAMERLAGEDGERFVSHGLPSLPDTLDVIVQVLSALAEAHAVGLVHRDLKPANLFLRRLPSGRLDVKVLDFGLAKVMGDELGLTSSQGFIGSPLYVAPEQLRRSSDVDARADVWGIGCLLYRFVSGRVPFPAASIAEVVTRIQRDEPTPLRTLRPDVPPALSTLVAQLLEKNPLKRPASVLEVGLRLRPLVTGRALLELDDLLERPEAPTAALPVLAPSSEPSRTWWPVVTAFVAGVGATALVFQAWPATRAPAPVLVNEVKVEPAHVEERIAPPAPVNEAPRATPTAVTTKPRGMLPRDAGSVAGADVFEGRE